jgi:hypothetical protein
MINCLTLDDKTINGWTFAGIKNLPINEIRARIDFEYVLVHHAKGNIVA